MGSITSMNDGATKRGSQANFAPETEFPTNITFEDIAKYPGRACIGRMGAPTKPSFVPSSPNHVVYLQAGGAAGTTQTLWKLNLKDGKVSELARPPTGVGEEDTLSEEEKLRRERTRQLHTGITNYQWAGGSKDVAASPSSSAAAAATAGPSSLICQVGNDLMRVVVAGAEEADPAVPAVMEKLVDGSALPGPILDPRISKDGSTIVFCCERELYYAVLPSADAAATTTTTTTELPQVHQLTTGARDTPGVTNGQADFTAMEEMDRYEGYWISPDAQFVVYEQADESHIPPFRISHSGKSATATHPSHAHEDHHYPFAGDANPRVTLHVTQLGGGEPMELDITTPMGSTDDIYLARVQWMTNTKLFVQLLSRTQTELVLLEYDTSSASAQPIQGRVLLTEKQPDAWVNLHNILVPIPNSAVTDDGSASEDFDFVWASERTGYQHLYRYNRNGKLVATLTSGEWVVESTSVSMIDRQQGFIYFTGTKDGCTERHLYRTSLDGNGDVVKITAQDSGMHTIVAMSVTHGCYIDSWSSMTQPFRVAVRSLTDSSIIHELYNGATEEKLKQLELVPPELFQITANDNATTLHGALYKPDPTVHGSGPYPTIVAVYGGPHVQYVANIWTLTADLRAQRLRSQGYAILKVDNRGSARRGLAFERFLHNDMGNIEVQDQAAAVQHWIDEGVVNKAAVGIYGWSYGGYMSAMCLAKRPDMFHAAVAGALVSSWDSYDTCYTERYMGTPQSNPDGYARSAIMPYVRNIQGSLLIVHGLIDENVHFRHSACLINSLIHAQKHYELLLFPDERHVPRGVADKVFMEQRIASFLHRSL